MRTDVAIEVSAQISYNGYIAGYKVNCFDATFYHAELTDFSGLQTENTPSKIYFIRVNEQAISSSDVIKIARDLLKQIPLK